MKTQIIQLEPHDDIISIRDKMGWSQTGRVVLVWPTRGHLLSRHLDLVLILRHSRALGVQIALVTRDPEVRFQANSLDIPVYGSVRSAQKSRWKRPRRRAFLNSEQEKPWDERLEKVSKIIADPLHRKREARVLSQPIRIGLFALAVLAVLAVAAALIPSADIEITPETKEQEITLYVQAKDSVEKINLTGILPVRWTSTTVEGRGSLQTSGSIFIPMNYASGEVIFQNLTNQPVVIPTGTVVSTADSNHRFATLRQTSVPAGPGEEVEIPIQAISPGTSSNLPPGRIKAIEGELGVYLTVNNLNPTTGGSMSPSPAPSTEDRDQLKEQLISTLTENALLEMQDIIEPEDILLTETPTLVKVLSETFSPAEYQPASELELILRLEYKAPYISAGDIDELARGILGTNLPTSYKPIPHTMVIDHLTQPTYEGGLTTPWRIQISQSIQSEPSTIQAVSIARGRSPQQAGQLLMEGLSLSSAPQITTFPSWWPIMPLIPMRIDVKTTSISQTSTTTS